MFVLNPDPYLVPCYRISPFTTNHIKSNFELPVSNQIDDYFLERFKGKNFYYTINGREAIRIALSNYKLHKNDIVTILTTSGNFYISQCVTNEIEKFCRWSRKIEGGTKVVLLNHEFGYPYNDILKLKEFGIPIIEDCAHTFFSQDKDNAIGKVGDFVVYSFPKMFPIQIGGLLVSNLPDKVIGTNHINNRSLRYIKDVLSHYIEKDTEIIQRRVSNYKFLRNKFLSLGFEERFTLHLDTIPGVFMFKTGSHILNLQELKKYYWEHGVQCSVFYGEKAFFIPVHQSLSEHDMNYFYEVMKSYLKLNMA